MYLSCRTGSLNFHIAVQGINISIFPTPLFSFDQIKSGTQINPLLQPYSSEPNVV